MIKEEIKKEDNENVAYAGFWSRYAALLIDLIIVQFLSVFILLVVFISLIFLNVMQRDDVDIIVALTSLVAGLITILLLVVYFIFTTYKFQATFGKMAVGAIVKREDDKKLSLKKIIIREILKFIQMIFAYIPLVVVAFTQKKQGLHDLAVKSVVVYKDPKKGANKWVVGLVIALHVLSTLPVIFVLIAAISQIDS